MKTSVNSLVLRASVLFMWGYVALIVLGSVPILGGKTLVEYRYHHLLPYAMWSALQPAPAMYNLANNCKVKGYVGAEEVWSRDLWINHHPLRAIHEDQFRKPRKLSTIEYQCTSSSGTNSLQSYHKLERKVRGTFELMSQ